MVLVSLGAGLSPARAASLEGSAQVVTPGSSGGAPLLAGNSDTDFSLKLPSGAACAGDSSNDEWRWQTYVVPEATDPATLQFGSQGPVSPATGTSFRQPQYTTTGSPVVNQQTADKTPPNTVGPIINIPTVDYAVWGPGDIGPGTYNVGIACTKGPASATQLDRYWNTKMTFTAAPAGQGGPAQVNWTAQDTTSTTSTTSTTVPPTTSTTSTTVPPTTSTTSTTVPPTTSTTSTTVPPTTSTTSTTVSSTTTTTQAPATTTTSTTQPPATTTTTAPQSITVSPTTGTPGTSVTVTAGGYQPNSQVQVFFLSTPVLLASPTADASGLVRSAVAIPSNATAGAHTIEVRGTGSNGAALTQSVGFTVIGGTLPRTGLGLLTPSLWAVLLVLLGGAALWLGRAPVGEHSLRS